MSVLSSSTLRRSARHLRPVALPGLLGLLAAAALACSPAAAPDAAPGTAAGTAADAAAAPAGDEGETTPAARLGDEVITIGEVDARIKDELFQRQAGGDPSALYEMRSETLETMIHQRILEAEAEAQDTTPEALVSAEAEKAVEVSDEEVQAFYAQHQDQIGAELEQVEPQIREHLTRQKQTAAATRYLQSLREARDVQVLIESPRVEVAATGPSRGPDDAPVTIIEFSDYQCPYCKRAEPVIDQILERYPEQVRLVYRHFPLDNIHAEARQAAHAAVCAEAQDAFWPFHEALFAREKLDREALLGYAEELELDTEAFEACLEAPETKQRVTSDLAAGREVGVTGTPAFFVNGVPLRGARPLADFVEVIERELAEDGQSS